MLVDYYFSYRYTLRNILLNKLYFSTNTYFLPIFDKIVIFIPILNLDYLNSRELYNYFYLFKFYFGRRAFVCNFKEKSLLGVSTYKMKIQLILSKSHLYSVLFFIVNDLFFGIDKSFLKNGIFSKDLNIFYIILKDLNFFSEKKTNLGLFNLKSSLHIHLFIKGCFVTEGSLLLKSFKINQFK